MAREEKKSPNEQRLKKVRERIKGAFWRLNRSGSLFEPLLEHIVIVECRDVADAPLLACVDPAQGAVWLNPYRRQELGEAEWTFVLAHEILHLALNHHVRRMHRDPALWNLTCDYAIDRMLTAFKIGRTPHDYEWPTLDLSGAEEELYDLFAANRRLLGTEKTFAGPSRPDLTRYESLDAVRPERLLFRHYVTHRRTDYENLFVEGVRSAVQATVEETAEALGQLRENKPGVWRPIESARRWVMNELPLLGALAAQMQVIAKADLCDRMDIAIAAVNPYLGEIYFHPLRGLNPDELLFVYVHELLHVALLHHTRLRGRDPWLWNVSCDFVINGWLIEMGVGQFPSVGGLYDPRLAGMSAEQVYDLLTADPRRCKGLRGFCGKKSDVILDDRRVFRGDITTLDDFYRRCLASGLACHGMGRGHVPLGLIEEIRSLFTPPVPWDVELARWMDAHVPILRDPRRTYARASRRQASTPDIPRPARFVPQETKDACTFGVIMDTSGSMDRELLGRALGAVASYAEARDVPAVRLVLCDASPYDRGIVSPTDLRGVFPIQGRGGTVLQPAINYLLGRGDFPAKAPIMILTDGYCEQELICPREHCFLLPRKGWREGQRDLLRTSAPVFRVLKPEREVD